MIETHSLDEKEWNLVRKYLFDAAESVRNIDLDTCYKIHEIWNKLCEKGE